MDKEKNAVRARAIDMLYDIPAEDIETLIIMVDYKDGEKISLKVAFAGDMVNAVSCCGEFLRALAGQPSNAVGH